MAERRPEVADELAAVFQAYPGVHLDQDNIQHHLARLERRFVVNRCNACARLAFPMRSVCPDCWSDDLEPVEISGEGTLFATTILHAGVPSSGIDYESGHPVGIVELAEQEGLRVITSLVPRPGSDFRPGTSMRLCWVERNGAPYPVFQETDPEP